MKRLLSGLLYYPGFWPAVIFSFVYSFFRPFCAEHDMPKRCFFFGVMFWVIVFLIFGKYLLHYE